MLQSKDYGDKIEITGRLGGSKQGVDVTVGVADRSEGSELGQAAASPAPQMPEVTRRQGGGQLDAMTGIEGCSGGSKQDLGVGNEDIAPTTPSTHTAAQNRPVSTPRADPDSTSVKWGENSISGEGAATMNERMAKPGIAQNVLEWMAGRLLPNDEHLHSNIALGTMGTQSFLYANDSMQAHRGHPCADQFNLWTGAPLPIPTVNADNGRIVQHLARVGMTSFMQDSNNFNTRSIGGALVSVLNVPQATAAGIASFVELSHTRVDNTALYAKGWWLCLTRASIEWRGNYNQLWAAAGDGLLSRNLADAANILAHFEADVSTGRFVLLGREFTEPMVNCLIHLSRAGPALNEVANRLNPSGSRINWFGVPMALYNNAERPIPAMADFTADAMRATLVQLAATRDEVPYLVSGYIKALTIFGTKRYGAIADPTWFTCTCEEFGTFNWPHPADYNPIWRWLSGVDPLDRSPTTAKESAILEHLPTRQLLRIGIVICSLISTGFGLAFHKLNISGRFLNFGISPNAAIPGHIHTMARILFWTGRGAGTPMIFRIVCGEISHVTQVAIDPDSFVQDAWSANIGREPPDIGALWAGVFGFRAPYLLHPLCTGWMMESWPAVYGMFSGKVQLNIQGDLIRSGPQAAWQAARGCDEYARISTQGGGDIPFHHYIPYGMAVMNAVAQHFRAGPVDVLQVQRWGRGHGGTSNGAQVVNYPNLAADDFVGAISTWKPGSIMTYDWETDETLSPVIDRMEWGPAIWQYLKGCGEGWLEHAGVISANVMPMIGGASVCNNMLGMFKDFSIDDDTGGDTGEVAAAPKVAENSKGPAAAAKPAK